MPKPTTTIQTFEKTINREMEEKGLRHRFYFQRVRDGRTIHVHVEEWHPNGHGALTTTDHGLKTRTWTERKIRTLKANGYLEVPA